MSKVLSVTVTCCNVKKLDLKVRAGGALDADLERELT